MGAVYHEGELEIQRRAGVSRAAVEVGDAVRPQLPAAAARFLPTQRLALLAARDADGATWCVPLSGPAGFLRVLDARTVQVDAPLPTGHPLAAALTAGMPVTVGLLVVDLGTRTRVRINGRGGVLDGSLFVRVEQAYPNCRKYLVRRLAPEAESRSAPSAAPPGDALAPRQAQAIAAADTFFIGSCALGGADASHRGGRPGFVTVRDPARLAWPDYTGNSMFNTLGNLQVDPRCGLLFLDWERGDALTLTGTARVDWDRGRAAGVPGAERVVDFAVERVVDVADAMPAGWRLQEHSPASPQAAPVGDPAD